MKNRRRTMAAAIIGAASILMSLGSIAEAQIKQVSCTTESGNFYVLGKGPGGRAALCKWKQTCLMKNVVGNCEKIFGCSTFVSTTYTNCQAMASAPAAKITPKVTPGAAEAPLTTSPKVPPTGSIQRN